MALVKILRNGRSFVPSLPLARTPATHDLSHQVLVASFASTRDSRPPPSGEQEGNMKFPQTAARVGRGQQADSAMSDGATLEEHQLHQQAAAQQSEQDTKGDPHAGFAPVTKMRMEQAGKEKTTHSQPWRDPNSDKTDEADTISVGDVLENAKQAVADVADTAKKVMPDVGQTVASAANWVKEKAKQATERVQEETKKA